MSVTRTIRNEQKAISLRLSDLNNGGYLLYKLKVWGTRGKFSIVDEKSRVLMKSTDFPEPQQDCSRKWPETPSEIPNEKDIIYTLTISFNEAQEYSYVVEYYKADGSLPVTLKNIDYKSENAADSDYNTLRILLT